MANSSNGSPAELWTYAHQWPVHMAQLPNWNKPAVESFWVMIPKDGPQLVSLQSIFVASLLCTLFLTYTMSSLFFVLHRRSQSAKRQPPIVPHYLPYVGNAISFALNPSACMESVKCIVGSQGAYGVKLLGNTLYFLTGPKNIARIWKYRTSITDPGIQTFCLIRVFGMAKSAVEMYTKDDSGIELQPRKLTFVKSHNRIDYQTHTNFVKMLSGGGLTTLYERWLEAFCRRLRIAPITADWKEHADIMSFWMPPLTASLNEAMVGPKLEQMNPAFTNDFIEFLPFVHPLMKGLPRWWMPRAMLLRGSLQRAVKEWHDHARTCFSSSSVDPANGSDPWWGLETMRERQAILGNVDNWDSDALASSDFGLLWGANINVHTAAIWTIVEIFQDQSLLSRVRSELDSGFPDQFESVSGIDQLLKLPLLQSVYSEVLRLRVEVQTVFRNKQEDIHVNEWRIPKESLLLVPTGPAHMDAKFWNTRDGQFPLNTFWSDRFLAFSDDPKSGPQLRKAKVSDKGANMNAKHSGYGPVESKYITAGTADSWIPYGVGERTCPGRFFARREIVTFCAQIVKNYDIQILTVTRNHKSSPEFYGLGVQRPLHAIPFKIRKR